MSTFGIDFKEKDAMIGDKKIKVQIWDTAGQERFRNITNSYYRGAHGIAVVYDVTNLLSFDTVTVWVKEINKRSSRNSLKVLIANKTDMTNLRVVTEEQGKNFAKSNDMYYFEASAKDDVGVNEAFDFMTNKIYSNFEVCPDFLLMSPENLLKKVSKKPEKSRNDQLTVCVCCKV
jgi:small GTP-binding protein